LGCPSSTNTSTSAAQEKPDDSTERSLNGIAVGRARRQCTRNGISHLRVTRFLVQDRLNALYAIKRLMVEATDWETGLADGRSPNFSAQGSARCRRRALSRALLRPDTAPLADARSAILPQSHVPSRRDRSRARLAHRVGGRCRPRRLSSPLVRGPCYFPVPPIQSPVPANYFPCFLPTKLARQVID
jgi:hypothetical protein